MFRQRSEEEYATRSEGGVRHLFQLGPYEFQDTMDGEDQLVHFVLESASPDAAISHYEVDTDTMYEFMARFLAGRYEMEEYELDQSPGHSGMLDVLEIATARARAGETDFSWEEIDRSEIEVMDEEVDEEVDEDADEDDEVDEDADDGADGEEPA